MPQGLKRFHHTGDLHFITFSCYHRLPYLASDHAKQAFEQFLEQTRTSHEFEVHGYVLMPEHVHLLLSEPTHHDLATTLKVLKQQTSKLLKSPITPFWQTRYFDFNVRTKAKRLEKLRYMHANPVKRGLVTRPELYPWSSAEHYAAGTPGTLHIDSAQITRNRPSSVTCVGNH
jgi:putative transposase